MNHLKNYEIDMCHGSIFPKIIIFTIPLILTGMLQLFYNAADIMVVGQFAGKEALAAVGSTGSLTNMLVNLFMGLSVGVSVCVSKFYGAGELHHIEDTVHTAVAISAVCGIFIGGVGILFARPMLELMDTPSDVIDGSVLYMQIFFSGMPANLIYNFGSGILRAIGDTKRPLYFLTISGICNVILNLIFVIVFHMSVAGVALATIISQTISMVLVIRCLIKSDNAIHLDLRKLHISKDKLLLIMKNGIPAGIQGSLFAISNVLIQSSINSFGSVTVAASAAASNVEGFVSVASSSLHQAAITFASQNLGAREYKRIDKVAIRCIITAIATGLLLGSLVNIFGEQLLSLYNSDPAVIEVGRMRLRIMCYFQFLGGMMDVACGLLRGVGYSVIPMFVTLTGVCAFRIIWIYTVFAKFHTLPVLFVSYPVTWGITAAALIAGFLIVRKKLPQKNV